MEERNVIGVSVSETINALNSLMTCNEVSQINKAVMRINRFKQWILSLEQSINHK